MDNNLLYEISYTLNDIRDSLNKPSGLKSFIPGVIGLVGGLPVEPW